MKMAKIQRPVGIFELVRSFFIISGLAVVVSACSFNSSVAPIETRNTAPDSASIQPENMAPIYVVKPGDTLYSIAWRAGRDFRQLAQWNHIEPPYTIKYGQRIKLSGTSGATQKPAPSTLEQESVAPYQADDAIEVEALPDTSTRQPDSVRGKQSAVVPKNPVKVRHAPPARPALGKVKRWMWPAKGKHKRVVSRKRGMDGVAIFGKRGQAVKAAAPGEVVYQGSGILGLGKLVIIKHNETYLSAYAHNDQILVKEGQRINQGQVIAKMGKSDAERVNLYFEIRKNGKPVNPLKILH